MKSRVLTAVVAVAALAGCGSTVEGAGSSDTSVLGPGDSGLPGEDGSLGVPGGPGGGGTSTTGPGGAPIGPGGVPTTGGPGGAALPTGGGGGGGDGSPLANGPGVTPKAIYVGITYTKDAQEANNALGAGGASTGNEQADYKAVVDDINAHGGVAGRKLKPVWHGWDIVSAKPYAQQDEEACADFTQDHHVIAVLGGGLTDHTLPDCLARAGTLMLESSILDRDNAEFARYPYSFDTGTVSQDRMMADQVRTLLRMNYFSGWNTSLGRPGNAAVKLGILSFEIPSWQRPLRSVLLPALAKAGHPVDSGNIYEIADPGAYSELGKSVAQIQNAILKFRQKGVTHVIMLDANGSMTLQFATNARSQRYYPRLGANTATGLQALLTLKALTPEQANGAVGLAWQPSLDLSAEAGNKYATSETRQCLKVVKERTGQEFDSTNAAAIALGGCDRGYLLARGITAAGAVINWSTIRTAIERLGGRFVMAGLPAAHFSPSQHDAVVRGYDMKFDNDCGCVKYVGEHRIP